MRMPWVAPALFAALLVPAAVASLSAMRVREPEPVAPATGQAATCLVGPGENQVFVSGNAPVSMRGLDGSGDAQDAMLTAAIKDPMVLHSQDRFAGGVLAVSGATRAWAACSTSRTTGVVQLVSPKSSDLLLANPDDVGASVDLKIFGPNGEVDALGARGIAVAPKGTRLVPSSALVKDNAAVSVGLRAASGRVAAIGRIWNPAGSTFAAMVSPATALYVPGLFPAATKVQVVLANPNPERIQVSISGLTTQRIALADAQNIDVEPGSTKVVDITAAMGGEGGGLAITANHPVAASVWTTVGQDNALVAGAEPLLVGRVLSPTGGSLAVTNTSDRQVSATIEIVPAQGARPPVVELVVPPHSTKRVDVAGTGRVQLDLLATSPVVAALTTQGAAGATVIPLQPMTVIGRGEVTMSYDLAVR